MSRSIFFQTKSNRMRKIQIFLRKKTVCWAFLFFSGVISIWCFVLISLYIIIYNNYIMVNFGHHFEQVNFLLIKWRTVNITTWVEILRPYLKPFLSNCSKCLPKNVKNTHFTHFFPIYGGQNGGLKARTKSIKIFLMKM